MIPLEPHAYETLEPIRQRWARFVVRLRGRIQEVMREADPGVAQIIAIDPLNTGAISAALSAVGGRLRGLGDKVQEAEASLSAEWDVAVDAADLHGAAAGAAWNELVDQSRALQAEIARTAELFEVAQQAAWARALYPLAEREVIRRRECGHCGAGIQAPIVHQAANVTCVHCGAVSTLEVGVATGIYFSSGVHALCREAACQAWIAQDDAERWYRSLRHPAAEERGRYLDAVRAYWSAYYSHYARLHPGFLILQSIEQAVEGRMAHYLRERW